MSPERASTPLTIEGEPGRSSARLNDVQSGGESRSSTKRMIKLFTKQLPEIKLYKP